MACELHGVSLSYDHHEALTRLDVSIAPGERVGLVGPSGAGKSSLIGLLNGSLQPTLGQVRVLGRELGPLRPRALRRLRARIGTVYQDFRLVNELRVIHNVNAGQLARWSNWRALAALWSWRPSAAEAPAAIALRRVGLPDKLYARADSLSGGERQRVAIARVLVQAPELILADEPIASLDPARGEDVLALLCEVARESQATLVVSLHDIALARAHCDRLIGLRTGRILFDRPAGEVHDQEVAALYALHDP